MGLLPVTTKEKNLPEEFGTFPAWSEQEGQEEDGLQERSEASRPTRPIAWREVSYGLKRTLVEPI